MQILQQGVDDKIGPLPECGIFLVVVVMHTIQCEDISGPRRRGRLIFRGHVAFDLLRRRARESTIPGSQVVKLLAGQAPDRDPVHPLDLGFIQLLAHVARQALINRLVNFQPVFPRFEHPHQLLAGGAQLFILSLFLLITALQSLGFLFDSLGGGLLFAESRFADGLPDRAIPRGRHRQADQQRGRGGHRPRLLATHLSGGRDFGWQQRGVDVRQFEGLQRQAVRHAEGQQVVLEQRRVQHVIAGQPLEAVDPLDLVLQVLLQELLQSRQPESVTDADQAANLGTAVDAGKEADRSLDFGHVVVEHRTQRLEHGARIRRLGGVALQVFGLGERQLHFLGEGAGEVIATHRHVADPDLATVGHHQRRVVAAHVDHDRVIFGVLTGGAQTKSQPVVAQEVVQSQGRDLDEFDLNLLGQERLHVMLNLLALHREQPDLAVQDETALLNAAAERLEIPDDLFQGKRDLLTGLVLHNLPDSGGFDRRQLNELCQGCLTRQADGDQIRRDLVAGQKGVQRLPDQLVRNSIGLAEQLGMRNVVEGDRHHLLGRLGVPQLDGLQTRLTDLNAPCRLSFCHDRKSPRVRKSSNGLPHENPLELTLQPVEYLKFRDVNCSGQESDRIRCESREVR